VNVLLRRVRDAIGIPAVVALSIIAACVVLQGLAIRPLEARVVDLERSAMQAARRGTTSGALRRVAAGSDQVAAFRRYFDRGTDAVEWLGKLHVLAQANGLDVRSADYHLAEPRRMLDRYQVSLPLTGSYAQVRSFLQAALAECPIAALEQVSFRRHGGQDSRVDADVTLTLYLPRA